MTITGSFERFHFFNFEANFLENAKPFQITGIPFENTKNESATFPYKTALSEFNVKTNRRGSIKLTYHEERSFGSNYFIFTEILFQSKNLV